MPTILIYDLNKAGREAIRQALSVREEWELCSAATRRQALRRLQDDPVDLVVVDAQTLERTDDTWLECRPAYGSPRVPVIVLATAAQQTPTVVEELLLGSASYVPGSTEAHDLVETVEQILQLARGRRRPLLIEAQQTTETKFTLEQNNLELLPILARHLAGMCEEFAICPKTTRRQVAVALEKAMLIGIVHGNLEVPVSLRDWDDEAFKATVQERRQHAPYRERKLWVSGRFTPQEARFTIRHEGPALAAAELPDPAETGGLETPHVRGWLLIRTFMDQVNFNEQGKTLHLVKRAPANSALEPDAVTN
jgi:DNA-binding NarL/FixJ family response regulator